MGVAASARGTLLDDADPATQIPYFLTAHHCVPDQARASSLETYWLYRSLACGGSVADAQAVTGGAVLLYTARPTDTSFLRLRRAPPAGVVFANWQAPWVRLWLECIIRRGSRSALPWAC